MSETNNNTTRRPPNGIGRQLASSFDSAVRLFRNLTFPSPRRPTGTNVSRTSPAARHAATSSETLQGLRRARQHVMQDIVRLEQELERLHGTIASGGRGAGAADRGGLNLNTFMERVRQVRDQLEEKRSELSRIDRGIARERQLLGNAAADEPRPVAQSPAASSTQHARHAKIQVPVAGRAVASALRGAKIADRAEYLLVEGLAEGLVSEEAEVRRQAVAKLGSRPQPVVSLLLLAVDDPEDSVRLAALGALTGQKHAGLASVFRRFLRDKNSALRLAALRGLASIDAPQVTHSDLVAALEDSDAGVRRVAASVLSWHREDAKMPLKTMHALGLALYDPDEAVRVSAAEALGTAGDDRMVLALIRAVGDSAEVVSKAAQRSLHSLVGKEVDSVAQGAPAAERVEALKAWWRTARVRMRSGPAAGGETLEHAARDVLQTIATMRGGAPAKEAAPAPAAAAKAKAAPAKEGAAAPAKETKAAAKEAKAAAEPKAAAAPEPKPAPEAQAAGAAKPAEPAPAEGGADKGDFESVFQESEGEDASAEGYETLLGGDKEP